MSNRLKEVVEENIIPTDEEVTNFAFRKFLRRMSDQEYDDYDRKRFEGMTEKEIKSKLIDDIRKGYGP